MKMKNPLFLTLLALFIYSCSSDENNPPNLLFIMMDDLGYGHFAPHNENLRVSDLDPLFVSISEKWIEPPEGVGHHPTHRIEPYSPGHAIELSRIATPTLSGLARDGVVFTSAFTCNSLCAPSRLGLATGMNPSYFGVYANLDCEQRGLDPGSHLAEKLHDLGYATAHIGKWHIGRRREQIISDVLNKYGVEDSLRYSDLATRYPEAYEEIYRSGYYGSVIDEHNPLQNGFDYYFGYNYWASQFYNSTAVWENYTHAGVQRDYNTDAFTDTALSFIRKQVELNNPFYVQLHYHAVHDSLKPKAPDKYFNQFTSESYDLTNFYAHMYGVDFNIKRIIDYLDKEGILNNTIIVFTSDNGAESGGPSVLPGNAPFAGHKATYYQGGVRVPLLFYWPEKIKTGFRSDMLVSNIDILPTLIDAAGGTVPGSLDGKSLLPVLKQEATTPVHDYLYWVGMHARYWGFLLYKSYKNDYGGIAPGAWTIVKDDYLLRYVGTIEPGLYMEYPEGRLPAFELYNLKTDPGETRNLAEVLPGKVEELSAIYYREAREFPPPFLWDREKWEELLPSE